MNTPTIVRTILVACVVALISVGIEIALAATTGTTAPLVAVLGIVVASWYGGIPCGLGATAGAAVLTPLALPPLGTFRVADVSDFVRLAALVVVGTGTTLLVASMRRTAETLKATLISIGDGVLLADAAGRVKILNREAERLTGWTSAQAKGKPIEAVFRIINEETLHAAENPVQRVLREGVVVGLANHTLLISRDGTERPIDDSAAPVRHHSGRTTGAVLVFRDDSLRRAAERQAEQFRAFVAATSDVVYRMSADWTEMRFLDGKEFIADTKDPSRTWMDKYIHPDDQPTVRAAIAHAIRTKSTFQLEHRVVRVDGTLGWTFSRAIPLLHPQGEIAEWLGAASDVTARRHAEEALRDREQRLQEAGRIKDDFLATVSHELRTPLNAILGWTMLLRGVTDPARVERGLRKVDRNAKVLRQIIEDLLDFSRTVRGELRMQREPVDLGEVVLDAVDAINVLAHEKGVAIELEELPAAVVSGDGMRLQQVVTNLLMNAIKFTPAGGRVTVRQRHDGAWIVLTVEDTGVGIRADLIETIFDPFRQLEPHGATGLGLGLAIVRHVVEAHEGTVEAFSDGEGHGATFAVRLPRALTLAPIRRAEAAELS